MNPQLSGLKNRVQEEPLPWDLRLIVKKFLRGRQSLLDMFAGNADFLNYLPSLPPRIAFVDRLPPGAPEQVWNVKAERVRVKHSTGDCLLPFPDASFDLVLNRSGKYEISEVCRVLAPGGVFITQQIGGMNALDLCASLGMLIKITGRNLVQNTAAFARAGLRLADCGESLSRQRFYRIDDILYYIKHVPLLTECFDADISKQELAVLESVIEQQGYFDCISHRYFLVVEKSREEPAAPRV
ncbi:MAG: class I SAM-dependent methyltransferase [Treponema sp.]|jgi:SAM-dependent methyltransferase|nr:class I SAM-dependent methyltransferase [Treponema sp.]